MYETQLINACKKGDLKAVEIYVKNGSTITFSNNFLLDLAATNGHLELVAFLIENGAEFENLSFTKKCAQESGYKEILDLIDELEIRPELLKKIKSIFKRIFGRKDLI